MFQAFATAVFITININVNINIYQYFSLLFKEKQRLFEGKNEEERQCVFVGETGRNVWACFVQIRTEYKKFASKYVEDSATTY